MTEQPLHTQDDTIDRAAPQPAESPSDPSLIEDLEALYEDGKTYAQAELQFQKTRARFVGTKAKSGTVFGLAALATLHLALIGLTVGLIFGLADELGPWAATAIVVAVLLVLAAIAGWFAVRSFSRIGDVLGGDDK